MLVFWMIAFALALVSVAAIAWPLAANFAPRIGTPDQRADEMRRLAEIDRDLKAGLIDAQTADEARREARAVPQTPTDAAVGRDGRAFKTGRFAAIAALGAAPMMAVGIYLALGAPELVGAGGAGPRPAPQGAVDAATNERIAALKARLQDTGEDFDVWLALGEAYSAAQRFEEAADAFSKATALQPQSAYAQSAYGEAMVAAARGFVTAEARAAFKAALDVSPGDARARYFLAEARYQVGAADEALSQWAALLNAAPPGAPWFSAVAARLKSVAAETGVQITALGLSEAATARLADRNTGAADAAAGAEAIAAMPAEQQRQMIETMVAGLAERLARQPEDIEGWRMLARSYRVLGQPEDSANAFRELLSRTAGGAEDWRQFAIALLEQRPDGDETVGPELEAALQKLRTFDPDDPLALYNLGLAARARGDKAEALALWERLRAVAPPEGSPASTLESLIESVKP